MVGHVPPSRTALRPRRPAIRTTHETRGGPEVTNRDLKGFIDASQPSLRDQLDVDPIPVPKSTRMAASNRVEINPKVMMGKPVIRGTRITIELILRKLSEG